jgi:hypothetical protein
MLLPPQEKRMDIAFGWFVGPPEDDVDPGGEYEKWVPHRDPSWVVE